MTDLDLTKFKALIFDCYGTLVVTILLHMVLSSS